MAKARPKPAKQKLGEGLAKRPISEYFPKRDGPVKQGFGTQDSGNGRQGEEDNSVLRLDPTDEDHL